MASTNGVHTARLPPNTRLEKLPKQHLYEITKSKDKREKTLKDLLEADHSTIAPLREPNLILHSHMPHILGSALDLGLGAEFLTEAHDEVVKSLIEIDSTSLGEKKIEDGEYRKYLGNKQYTVAFVDYFDREFAKADGDWKKVTEEYLFAPDKLLMNGLVGGLGHPLIHLGYAYELNCKETASEGLSLLCTDFSDFNALVDHPQPQAASYRTESLADIFEHVRHDSRFDGVVEFPGITNMGPVMQRCAGLVIEHWNAWEIKDPLEAFQQICDLSTVLSVTTTDAANEFDFYLIHLMTMLHGLRVIWGSFPADRQAPMLREFAINAIANYICQQRPEFSTEKIESVSLDGRDWSWVKKTAAEHPARFDVHFFKVVRAPMAFKDTFGEKDGFYLKAAVKFLDEFRGWTGFGKGLDGFDPRGEGWYPEH